jgi:octaprenyl-diphosphate synthase
VNAKWTNLISVLMGDFLFARAFRIMVESDSLEMIKAISNATERVSVGELRQIEEMGNYSLTEEEYLDIISNKTASLFSVSCEIGPILNERGDAERRRFAEFGEKVGTAFQIADDLLDFTGDSQVTGKEPGNDVMNGNVTLPLIYSLKKASPASAREITDLLQNGGDQRSFRRILDFINETGGVDYAYQRAYDIAHQGLDAISGLKSSEYYDMLSNMVEYAVSRAS